MSRVTRQSVHVGLLVMGGTFAVKNVSHTGTTVQIGSAGGGPDPGARFRGKRYQYKWDGRGYMRSGAYLTTNGTGKSKTPAEVKRDAENKAAAKARRQAPKPEPKRTKAYDESMGALRQARRLVRAGDLGEAWTMGRTAEKWLTNRGALVGSEREAVTAGWRRFADEHADAKRAAKAADTTTANGLTLTSTRSGNAIRITVTGTANRIPVSGKTVSYHVGIDKPPRSVQFARLNRAGGGKDLPFGARSKVEDAVRARLRRELNGKGNGKRNGNGNGKRSKLRYHKGPDQAPPKGKHDISGNGYTVRIKANKEGDYTATFGRWESNAYDGSPEFKVSYGYRMKDYKTLAGAQRAARRFIADGKPTRSGNGKKAAVTRGASSRGATVAKRLPGKIVKEYGTGGGNRFAAVELVYIDASGRERTKRVDVKTRQGLDGPIRFSGATEIKAEAYRQAGIKPPTGKAKAKRNGNGNGATKWPATRQIDGKTYTLEGGDRTTLDAGREAKRIRKTGRHARVIDSAPGGARRSALYVHGKAKNPHKVGKWAQPTRGVHRDRILEVVGVRGDDVTLAISANSSGTFRHDDVTARKKPKGAKSGIAGRSAHLRGAGGLSGRAGGTARAKPKGDRLATKGAALYIGWSNGDKITAHKAKHGEGWIGTLRGRVFRFDTLAALRAIYVATLHKAGTKAAKAPRKAKTPAKPKATRSRTATKAKATRSRTATKAKPKTSAPDQLAAKGKIRWIGWSGFGKSAKRTTASQAKHGRGWICKAPTGKARRFATLDAMKRAYPAASWHRAGSKAARTRPKAPTTAKTSIKVTPYNRKTTVKPYTRTRGRLPNRGASGRFTRN